MGRTCSGAERDVSSVPNVPPEPSLTMRQILHRAIVAVVPMLAAAHITVGQSATPMPPTFIPDTPAGRMLRSWLDTFNNADSAAAVAFIAAHKVPQFTPALWAGTRSATGGFDVVAIISSQPQHIEFGLKERSGARRFARGDIAVSVTEPNEMTAMHLRALPPGVPAEGCKVFTNPATAIQGVADPKDVATEDAIIAAVYESISGPACQHRDWNRFRSLFASGARLIPTGVRDGKATARVETPEEYAAAASLSLEEAGFFEKEISRTGETFGAITQAFSTYESRRHADDATPFARGINSFQLLNDGTRWWIVTIYWQAERPDTPIPAQYLRKP
jgi:hypothetical protein